MRIAWLVLLLAFPGCLTDPPEPSASTAPSTAEQGRLANGTVVDEEGSPVAGARVTHVGGLSEATTDEAGAFGLTNLPPAADLLLQASHPAYRPSTVRVDLRYQASATVQFVLARGPSLESFHVTNRTVGMITCQVSVGSEHGPPGQYHESCTQVVPESADNVVVPIDVGVDAAVLELAWEPQSPMADVMGLVVYISSAREEILVGEVHSYPGEHRIHLFLGPTALAAAQTSGSRIDAHVHVEPGLVDDHIPTNLGAAVQQDFEFFVTAFYGDVPSPTWSARDDV